MAYTLPALTYAFDALEPHIDAQTMQIHHDKHHQAYVDNLNKALAGTDGENKSLEESNWKRRSKLDFRPRWKAAPDLNYFRNSDKNNTQATAPEAGPAEEKFGYGKDENPFGSSAQA